MTAGWTKFHNKELHILINKLQGKVM